MAPGVLSHAGLGNAFSKTGMSAFDATTWPQQIDFALDNVANHGWGDYATTAYQKLGYSKYTGISNPGRPMPDIASYKAAAPAGTSDATQQPAMPSIDPESLWVGPQAAPAAAALQPTGGRQKPMRRLIDPNPCSEARLIDGSRGRGRRSTLLQRRPPSPILSGPGCSPQRTPTVVPGQRRALSGFLQALSDRRGLVALPGMQRLDRRVAQSQCTWDSHMIRALSAIQG